MSGISCLAGSVHSGEGQVCGLGCLMLGEVCGDVLYGEDAARGDSECLLVSMVTGDELLEDTWEDEMEEGTTK